MKHTKSIALTLAGAGLLSAGSQAGTITPIQTSMSERSHAEVFERIFGGVFIAVGDGFSNGSIDIFRVEDDNDQTYNFHSWTAEALGVWAHAAQAFGTVDDGKLFDVTGSYGDPISGSYADLDGGTDIAFKRFGNEVGTVDVSTRPSDNPNGVDHVVTYTYSVDGKPIANEYLLFFEDLPEAAAGDFDYQDLVVRVAGNVPEPSSLALVTLGGLAMLRRRR